jgi:L-fucose mutarotase
MLKLIDPLLSPDLLHALAAMGHGDEIAIVDANFPATSTARRLIRADGVSATAMAAAILTLLPLDSFVPETAFVMQQVDAPDVLAPICEEFEQLVRASSHGQFGIAGVERFAFYTQTKSAYAVVATGERRLYGNLILKKGILPPPGG